MVSAMAVSGLGGGNGDGKGSDGDEHNDQAFHGSNSS
jgi:hypothetical protein